MTANPSHCTIGSRRRSWIANGWATVLDLALVLRAVRVPLAVSSAEPWFNLPGLKPWTELGWRDFVFNGWNGVMAPKGAPPAVIARLSEPLSGALHSGGLGARAFNTAMGFGPAAGIPEPMWQQIEADMRLLTIVVRERRLTFDS